MSMRRCLAVLACTFVAPNVARAGGKVTLCTSDVQSGAGVNLTTAMAGGGVVTFACKAGTTISVTQSHSVGGHLVIDGGNAVKLVASSYRAMFLVGGDLSLQHIEVQQPYVGLPSSPGASGIAVGHGALTLTDVRVRKSVNPFAIETITIERSLFENNATYVLVTAGVAVIAGSDFVNNNGAIAVRSNRAPGSGRTTVIDVTDSRFRHNGAAIQWTGRLRVRTSAFDDNGRPTQSGGAIRLQGDGGIEHTTFDRNAALEGGAVWLVGGTLSLRRVTFRQNTARKDGGAVGVGDLAEGHVVARYSTFVENKAERGGAIKLASSAQIALEGGPNSFMRNTAQRGGAIFAELGRIQLTRAVFADNRATIDGGAILGSTRGMPRAAVLANSLVVRNTSPDGAAYSGSALTLINSTVASNDGLAIALKPLSHFAAPGARGGLELHNAVVSNNRGGNCSALPVGEVIVHNGHNLQHPGVQCGTVIASADPQLDPLFVPAFGSPAYAGGENTVCTAAPISSHDVYNAVRPQGDACALGAVEGEIDPRLTRRLIGRLGERMRGSVAVLRTLWP